MKGIRGLFSKNHQRPDKLGITGLATMESHEEDEKVAKFLLLKRKAEDDELVGSTA